MLLGLLPTAVLASEGDTKHIAEAYATQGTGAGNKVDWLSEDASMTLAVGESVPFTINSIENIPSEAKDRTLSVTLKKGLQWVSYTASDNTMIIEPEGEVVTGYTNCDPYNCGNGTLTVNYSSTNSYFNAGGILQPDAALFTEQTTIEDAITISYSYMSGETKMEEQYAVDVTITGSTVAVGNDHNRTTDEVVLGERAQWYGSLSKTGGAFYDSLSFSITVPAGIELTTPIRFGINNNQSLSPTSTKVDSNTGATTYTFQVEKFYMELATYFIFYVVPSKEEVTIGKTYTIQIGDISYQLHGMTESATAQGWPWELKMVEAPPEEFYYELTGGNDTKNVNWTYYGNDTHDFTGYQTELGNVRLTLRYQNLAKSLQEYEYIVDASQTTGMFVDQVSIPCSYGQGTKYLPTRIEVLGSDGETKTLIGEDISRLTGKGGAANGMLYLRASDIPLDSGVSIVKVTAYIPRFSGDSFNNISSFAWGHFIPEMEVSGDLRVPALS